MNNSIESLIRSFKNQDHHISLERQNKIEALAQLLKQNNSSKSYKLLFVCTHNSRRSIFAQVWAKALADFYKIPLESYSGGTEVTEVNRNALNCLAQLGFNVSRPKNNKNPNVQIQYGNSNVINCFSKLFDDTPNPRENFFAIMLCEHAAENCPFIPEALERFNLTYPDPKAYDATAQQDEKYKEIALKIGQELSFLMRQL